MEQLRILEERKMKETNFKNTIDAQKQVEKGSHQTSEGMQKCIEEL